MGMIEGFFLGLKIFDSRFFFWGGVGKFGKYIFGGGGFACFK